MKVQDIMTAEPACCAPETPLEEVARLMVTHDCGELPVVRGGNARDIAGVITDRDIVSRTLAQGKNPLTESAGACMTSPAISVRADAEVDECIRLMESHKIRRVPVVSSDGTLCGIVSQADVARHASRQDTGELVRDVSTPTR